MSLEVQRSRALAARLHRHGLTRPMANEADYVELFRRLQPVSPAANSYPGSAPRLMHRMTHDLSDADVADQLRAHRTLVKGRFQGGTVAYVSVEDLPLFAAAYRQPLTRLDVRQEVAVRALTYAGPLSPRQLREETGLGYRPLMAAVHRLERAFILCEDQTDDAWDRPLHLVEREFPDLWTQAPSTDEAVAEVLLRLLTAQAFATTAQLACGSGLGKRRTAQAVAGLEQTGRIEAAQLASQDGAEVEVGWCVAGDSMADGAADGSVEPIVRVLHARDPLVRPQLDDLSQRFAGREVLQYLLIGDDIHGAACGHWRIKAHDVDDVVFPESMLSHKDAVLAAVRRRYRPPDQQVLACNGEPL